MALSDDPGVREKMVVRGEMDRCSFCGIEVDLVEKWVVEPPIVEEPRTFISCLGCKHHLHSVIKVF